MSGVIRVLPNSKRLKQLIKQHGEVWEVIDGPMRMQCFNGEIGVFARALSGLHLRNIKKGDFSHD
jgi:hypothetical protein